MNKLKALENSLVEMFGEFLEHDYSITFFEEDGAVCAYELESYTNIGIRLNHIESLKLGLNVMEVATGLENYANRIVLPYDEDYKEWGRRLGELCKGLRAISDTYAETLAGATVRYTVEQLVPFQSKALDLFVESRRL